MRHVLTLLLFLSLGVQAQTSYDDVAVIVNANSAESVEIGDYFASKRNLPSKNLIKIKCTTLLEIDSITYVQIEKQIEDSLLARDLQDDINYLVTTKGIPIKIRRADCFSKIDAQWYRCGSFDNELALLMAHDSLFKEEPFIPNPYFQQKGTFTRKQFGIFLVTRLDGITKNDVMELIDRSSLSIEASKNSSRIIYDRGKTYANGAVPIFGFLLNRELDAQALGWNTLLVSDTSKIASYDHVLGYTGFNFDGDSLQLPWNFSSGALVELVDFIVLDDTALNKTSYSSVPFMKILSKEVTGIAGYVYLNFVHMTVSIADVLDMYIKGKSLAEAYHANIAYLSWVYVVIGDPKFALAPSPLALTSTTSLPQEALVYPNPSKGSFVIETPSATFLKVRLRDALGHLLLEQTSPSVQMEGIAKSGLLLLEVETDKGSIKRKLIME